MEIFGSPPDGTTLTMEMVGVGPRSSVVGASPNWEGTQGVFVVVSQAEKNVWSHVWLLVSHIVSRFRSKNHTSKVWQKCESPTEKHAKQKCTSNHTSLWAGPFSSNIGVHGKEYIRFAVPSQQVTINSYFSSTEKFFAVVFPGVNSIRKHFGQMMWKRN